MRVRYHDHGEVTDATRAAVERELPAIERHFADLDDDQKLLEVHLDHHMRDNSYTAKLLLSIPDHVVPAHGDGDSRQIALRDAFKNLSDRLDTLLAKMRREPDYRREGKFHIEKARFAKEANEQARDEASTTDA